MYATPRMTSGLHEYSHRQCQIGLDGVSKFASNFKFNMVTRGIPVQLLHEAESHAVTVEIKNGEMYRGMLLRSQDNMNLELTQVTHSGRDGKISKMEQVFIRGSQIRFIVVPDLLKKAPMFETISAAGKAAQEQLGSYNLGSNSKKMIDRIPSAQ